MAKTNQLINLTFISPPFALSCNFPDSCITRKFKYFYEPVTMCNCAALVHSWLTTAAEALNQLISVNINTNHLHTPSAAPHASPHIPLVSRGGRGVSQRAASAAAESGGGRRAPPPDAGGAAAAARAPTAPGSLTRQTT